MVTVYTVWLLCNFVHAFAGLLSLLAPCHSGEIKAIDDKIKFASVSVCAPIILHKIWLYTP